MKTLIIHLLLLCFLSLVDLRGVAAQALVEVGDIEKYLQTLDQNRDGKSILLFGLHNHGCRLVAARVDQSLLSGSTPENGVLTLDLDQMKGVSEPLAQALESASYGSCANELLSFDTPVNRFAGAFGEVAGVVMVRRINPITGSYISAPAAGWGYFIQ